MRVLEWRSRGWGGLRELVEGDQVLATVRWTWTAAEATIRGRVLRVRHRGWWRSTVRLEDASGGAVAMMPLSYPGTVVAELPGRTYRWRATKWWRSELILESPEGRIVARQRPQGLGGRVRVEVEDTDILDDELLPLLVLEIHAFDLWSAHASTTAVVTTAT